MALLANAFETSVYKVMNGVGVVLGPNYKSHTVMNLELPKKHGFS
jgi:hypothetical protein